MLALCIFQSRSSFRTCDWQLPILKLSHFLISSCHSETVQFKLTVQVYHPTPKFRTMYTTRYGTPQPFITKQRLHVATEDGSLDSRKKTLLHDLIGHFFTFSVSFSCRCFRIFVLEVLNYFFFTFLTAQSQQHKHYEYALNLVIEKYTVNQNKKNNEKLLDLTKWLVWHQYGYKI